MNGMAVVIRNSAEGKADFEFSAIYFARPSI
jgi:hypothetical protein